MSKITNAVLLLEDHLEAQTWLSKALVMAYGPTISITIADTIAEAKTKLKGERFDLFLVDLNLPDGNGHEALSFAKSLYPTLTCVVTTIYSDDAHLFPALRAGSSGYILKDESKENIAQMLGNIELNIPAISSEVALRILSHFHEPTFQAEHNSLTEREQETLSLVAKGLSVKDCANVMAISHHTVSGYIKEIYRKLGISSRAELTSEAMRMGLLKL